MFLHQLIDDVLLHIVSDLASDIWSGKQGSFQPVFDLPCAVRLCSASHSSKCGSGNTIAKIRTFQSISRRRASVRPQGFISSEGLTRHQSSSPKRSSTPFLFLQRLPNLQSLSSESMCDVPSSVPSLLSGVLPLRCSLQVLSLHESLPTAINLFELLLFPTLRRLKIEHIEEFEIPKSYHLST